MNAGLIILRVASLGRDAQNERDGAGDATRRMSATELVYAAPSQQRLRRISVVDVSQTIKDHQGP